MSAIEDNEGLAVLEHFIAQGFKPLHVDSTIIQIDTTDFSKVDEKGIIKQVADLMNAK